MEEDIPAGSVEASIELNASPPSMGVSVVGVALIRIDLRPRLCIQGRCSCRTPRAAPFSGRCPRIAAFEAGDVVIGRG